MLVQGVKLYQSLVKLFVKILDSPMLGVSNAGSMLEPVLVIYDKNGVRPPLVVGVKPVGWLSKWNSSLDGVSFSKEGKVPIDASADRLANCSVLGLARKSLSIERFNLCKTAADVSVGSLLANLSSIITSSDSISSASIFKIAGEIDTTVLISPRWQIGSWARKMNSKSFFSCNKRSNSVSRLFWWFCNSSTF